MHASTAENARVQRERASSAVPTLPLQVLLDTLFYINMVDDDDVTIDFVSLGMFILGTTRDNARNGKKTVQSTF